MRRSQRPSVPCPARVLSILLISSVVVSAGLARAGDGVIELNAAVVAVGLPGPDAPGYPLTITTPGSYRLVGNLELLVAVGGSATDVVQVLADDVTLDLNGFRIECHQSTLPTQLPCSGLGGLAAGIAVQGDNVEILNGTIRGMAGDGIDASYFGATGLVISGIRAVGNGNDGLSVHSDSRITDSMFRNNGVYGIRMLAGGHHIQDVVTIGNRASLRLTGFTKIGGSSLGTENDGSLVWLIPLSCNYMEAAGEIFPFCP